MFDMIINPRKKVYRPTPMAITERIIDDPHGVPLCETAQPSGRGDTEGQKQAAPVDMGILE